MTRSRRSPKSADGSRRVTVLLPPGATRTLDRIMDSSDWSATEVLRRGVELLELVVDAQRDGVDLAIVRDGEDPIRLRFLA